MNFTTVLHQAKSEYAYAYNENTLHIRLKTERGAVRKVELLALVHLIGFLVMTVL